MLLQFKIMVFYFNVINSAEISVPQSHDPNIYLHMILYSKIIPIYSLYNIFSEKKYI